MRLKTRFLNWFTGSPVVMLPKKTADEIGVPAKGRVLLKTISKKPLEIMAIINTVENLINNKEIIVSNEVKKILKLKKSQELDVILAEAPESTLLIKKKLSNKTLSDKEIEIIVKDIVDNSLSDPEIALFVTAMYEQGMNTKETVSLIKSILKNGNKINLDRRLVVDKHSIGGIAGRTTPIVVSICAVAGLTMPKTSSRSITSAAGTADVMEAIADVDLSIDEIKKVIKKTNACIVWGGSLGLVPADDKIITVEKTLEIDPEAQLLSSIMAKKLAVGSNYIVIDIPFGKTAKVPLKKALHLKEKFEDLGKYFHKKIKCLLVENKGPLGNGVGPALELIDVLKVLSREDSCHNLENRSLQLAGALLEMTNKAKKGKGIILAKKILDSGKALEKFKQIVKAQNGNLNRIKIGKYAKEIFSSKSGKVIEINNKNINTLARIAGSPYYKGAGILLHVHEGEKIKKKDKLFTIYSESRTRANQALDFYKKNKIYHII